jgi:cyclophilin family peptidyl-prolyl cis-trans isomerase
MAARAAVLLACALALFGEARAVDRSDAFIGYSETTRPDSSAIALRTSVGDIVVRLRDDISPRTARYFREFASARSARCTGCEFHRAEAIPEPGAIDNYGGPGPPYALVQGRLGLGSRSDLPREGAPLVERGDVCVVGGGPDFFIATKAHHEWGNGHTVFGKVAERDMSVVDAIVRLPVQKQVWGQTHVTALAEKLPFTMATLAPTKLADVDDAGGGGNMLRGA